MPPATAATRVTLRELADLAIGTPEVGAVNFTALHSLIVAMLKCLSLQETRIDFQAPSPEQSRSFEGPRASVSASQLPAPRERRRSGVGRTPALEGEVKDLGVQVQDLSRQLKTMGSQVEGIAAHVQHLTAPAGGLDADTRRWLEEKEMAMLMPAEKARKGSVKSRKDSESVGVPRAMELLRDVVEDVKTLKEVQRKAQELPELNPQKLFQRIEELEKLIRDREEFLELVSRKLSLMPTGEEVTMVTWEELEQAITDGWKTLQAGSESTMGLPKRKGQTSLTPSDIIPVGASTKHPSADQTLGSASGLGPKQTLSGTGGTRHPSEGVLSRERSRGASATGFPGKEQHPRARDEAGLAKPHHPSVSQFRAESEHHRAGEQQSLAHLRRDEQDAHPGPVQQDLPSATSTRDWHHHLYPDQHGGVYISQGQVYPRIDQHGLGPLELPDMDQLAWLHPSTYHPHGVVPLSMGQLGMVPPGMDKQESVLPGIDQHDVMPPLVPGRDQQELELPRAGQPGMVPLSTYQHGVILPGTDQRGVEQPGMDESVMVPLGMDQHGFVIFGMDQQGLVLPGMDQYGLVPLGMDQHGLVPPLTDQHHLVSPGLMQAAADQQGFVQPSLETCGFVQPGTEQHNVIQPDAGQPALAQPGAGQPALAQHGAGQPALAQPGTGQPALVQPGAGQPALVQPGAGQPALVQPGAGQPPLVQPGAGQPALVQPGTGQPALVQPGAGQPALVQPGTGQPALAQPGAGQPALAQPGAGQPALVQPGAGQPALVQPAVGQPALVQSEAGQPALVQPGAGQPALVQPGAVQPALVQPGAGQPALVQPGAGQPALVQPGAGQPPLAQPAVGQPALVQPGAGQPALAQPAVGQPALAQPGAGQPALVQPGAGQPALAQPAVGQPALAQPAVGQPALVQPGAGQSAYPPVWEQPGAGQPGLVQPGMYQRGVVQPGMYQRGVVQPGMYQRGVVQPGMYQRGVVQPGMYQRGVVQPGMYQRGLIQPRMYQRGLVQPVAGQRGLVQPRMDQPGSVQLGADQPGLVQLGADQPGLVQPGMYQQGVVQPGMYQRGLIQPRMDQRGLVQPVAGQRGLVQPGVDQRGLVQPGVDQRGLVQPGMDQRGLVQPGVDQHGLVQPGADQPGLVQLGADQGGSVQPGMYQQGVVQPGMYQRGLIQPRMDQRGLVQPVVGQRGLVQPGMDQRGLVQPGVDQHGLVQPGVDQRGLVQPGADQPGLVQLGADQGGLVQPGADQGGSVQPGADQPGSVQPGTGQPGSVQPGTDQPGSVQPGTGQPGSVQPGTGQPGSVQPGTGQPGLVQPGADQGGLVQPSAGQLGFVQPGVDQRGLVQPGIDPRGFFQPGIYMPGLVSPGVYPPGLVQPGAYPPGLVQPGAYPRGLVQPGAYPHGFVQPGADQHGLVQPGIDQRGLRQPGTDPQGLIPPGTELRGFPTFHADSRSFISPRPYQHGVVSPGRDQHGQVSLLLADKDLALPGIVRKGLVPPETYQQSVMHPGADQPSPTPLSTGLASARPDRQHLVSPGPESDQRDQAYSIPVSHDLMHPGPHGPGYQGVDQYIQADVDPNRTYASNQPGVSIQATPSQDTTFFRSAHSLNYLDQASSDVLSERRDSLDKLAPSFPIAVETFRLMGELVGLYVELKENMKNLDEEKAGQTDLEKIQYLLAAMVQKTIPPDLQEQLSTLKALTKEIRQDKVKLDRMHKFLEGDGEQEIGKEMKTGQLSLQLGVLRVTVADIEKELAELRESQERGKVSMEHSVSEASLYLQDQLDKLRIIIESMLTSSSTLLSMSMAPHKAPTSLAPGQIDPEATCPACSLDLSHQVSTLVRRYEQLQDMVNNLAASRPSKKAKLQSQDEELLGHVQRAILQVQGDCEKLNITTSNLIEDHRQKQKDIDVLYQGLEKLEKEKANREHLEMEIDTKADKSALAAKVSRVQFDATTEQLNHMMQELVAKMSGQEQDWQKMLDKLLTEMDSKLDRLELDPVKELLEDRWKSLRQQLKERSPLYQADEAAAMRRQLLAHFHCLSCDRPLETPVTGQIIPVTPVGPGLPGHRSIRPYTVFELEQVRQQSRNLKLGSAAFPRGDLVQMERSVGRLRSMHSKMLMDIEKVQIHFGGSVKASSQMIRELLQAQCLSSPCYKRVPDVADYTYSTVPRRCGGSHTLTYPYRRSRPQHLPQGLGPTEEIQIAMKHDEVDILGLDGHIYKGRMDTRLPGILSKDTSGVTKHKAKQSRPHVHRQQSLGDNSQLPSRPQSAQMLAGNNSAPSHQRKDRPVSSEGRLSQPNLAHPPSPSERANPPAGLEMHMDVPPGEGLEEPTRGPRSTSAH